ncbi:metallophosphoesterase [Aquabacterium sp.]|uniref:metallophosphoesterase n=1 Tax=Aquabacterium sp. TaxID=1872578 RepID=UPI002B76BFCE|nr:metallophosphoesterase [Aquabacterium sp.]HSW08743.1 metallophosphoesterase [Aquabacterium sp.]
MKLNILSDLHLGFAGMARPVNDADVVVLAGDIARPAEAVAWALGLDKPVLYVLGNHEFYGGSVEGTAAEMKRLCAGTRVQVLDDSEVHIGPVRFVGSTLWTDFGLFDAPERRAAAVAEAQRLLRDFSRIRRHEASDALFTPADSVQLFERHARWLAERLATQHDGPTVVITHHAPSPRSIHPRFADSLLNACFVSDAERLLGAHRAALWIHGHTHDSFDYRVNGTRVVCNPRGYSRAGVIENARFDPDLIVEVV